MVRTLSLIVVGVLIAGSGVIAQAVPVKQPEGQAATAPPPPPPPPTLEHVARLERRLVLLEQQLKKQTEGDKDSITVSLDNVKKQFEKRCKTLGGRWISILPFSDNPDTRNEMQGVFFAGCVGK